MPNCPLVHTHGAYRQNQNKLAAFILSLLDLHGNLMAHISTEFFQIGAFYRGKVLVPERLGICNRCRIVGNTFVDFLDVSTLGHDLAEIGVFKSIEHVHSNILLFVKSLSYRLYPISD